MGGEVGEEIEELGFWEVGLVEGFPGVVPEDAFVCDAGLQAVREEAWDGTVGHSGAHARGVADYGARGEGDGG